MIWFSSEFKKMSLFHVAPPTPAEAPPGGGAFFADSRHALDLRREVERRMLDGETRIDLDFSGVRNTTQSWMNAFVGNLVLVYGREFARRVVFKGCNDTLKSLIRYVYADAMERRKSHQISEH